MDGVARLQNRHPDPLGQVRRAKGVVNIGASECDESDRLCITQRSELTRASGARVQPHLGGKRMVHPAHTKRRQLKSVVLAVNLFSQCPL